MEVEEDDYLVSEDAESEEKDGKSSLIPEPSG